MKKGIQLDLSNGIKRIKVITNGLVNSQIVGNYRSSFKGRGLEFQDYRQYSPNDDSSMIDWKASVRSKELLVRELVEERNLNVIFLIDVGSSMIYTTTNKLKMEYAAEIVATLSFTVLESSDSVGFVLFNDTVVRSVPPASGGKHYHKLVATLVDPRNYGGGHDLSEALKFTLAFLKEFSIVIIVSDFIDLKGDWTRYLKLIGQRFDLVGIMIRDPRDEELPDYDGTVIFSNMAGNEMATVDVSEIKDEYVRYVQSSERVVIQSFLEARADFIKLTTDKPFIKPISDLFLKRAKRIR